MTADKLQSKARTEWIRLFLTNVAYWTAAGSYSPFLSAYYKNIGLTASQIGLLFAVSPVCAICIQPLWAKLSDKTGKRKGLLMLLAVCTALVFPIYYGGNGFARCLIAAVCMGIFSSALLPLCDALVISRAQSSGCNFAYIRIGGTVGYAVAVVLIGRFLERQEAVQFIIPCGMYFLFAAIVGFMIPADDREKAPSPEKTKSAGGKIFEDRQIVIFLMFAFLSSAGLSFCSSFMGAYVVEQGYSQELVGILNCISALSEVPMLLLARKIIRRFGELSLLAFSSVMMSLRLLLTGIGGIPAMVGGQLLQSVTYITTYYCCASYISNHVRKENISQGQSILTLVQSGLASICASLLGGRLVDYLGIRQSYFTVAAIVFLLSVILLVLYRIYWRKERYEK